jgi:pimeloyl-ACP methyl ester carboxylesterase
MTQDKDPILWLPGFMQDARLFLPQIVALGAGRSMQVALPTSHDSVEAMSAEVLSQAPSRFVMVGQGLGGDIALDILRRAPERVSRLVLIATEALSEPPQVAAAREARIVAVKAGRLVEMMREEVPASALAETGWRDEVLALVRDMALNLAEGVYIRQSRALQRRPDQQKTMRRVKVPALILAGAADSLFPLRRAEFTAGLMPFGRLDCIPDAGHLPTLEQPEAVTAAIEAFLSGPVLLR